eukprot:2208916-Pyramimonas_sp.AAC.1
MAAVRQRALAQLELAAVGAAHTPGVETETNRCPQGGAFISVAPRSHENLGTHQSEPMSWSSVWVRDALLRLGRSGEKEAVRRVCTAMRRASPCAAV